MVIGLTFQTSQVLYQRQNEIEYKHTFKHKYKNEQKLVTCEKKKVQKAESGTGPGDRTKGDYT